MDKKTAQAARLYNKVFSTPRKSPERDKIVDALTDAELSALREYTLGVMSGKIKHNINDVELEDTNMSYKEFRDISSSDESGVMRKLSAFALENPTKYAEYREKYQAEQDSQLRLHNRRMSGY